MGEADVLQSMKTAKKFIAVAIALVAGGLFLNTGIREYRASKRLAKEGKATLARVVDDRTVYRSKGRSRYYLTVEFESEGSRAVAQELQVSRSIQTAGLTAKSVTVHYLPDDLSVCQVGPSVEVQWTNAAFGLFILGCGVVLIVFYKQPASREELAESTAESLDALCDTNQQYVSVEARLFKQVDHTFYDESQRQFEQCGFAFLEVVASKPNKCFARTFVRVLVSSDRTGVATIFHLKPRWMLKVLGAKEARVVGIDTQFADKTFVSTDNAESCNALDNPAAISVSHLPAVSSVPMVVEAHKNRVEARSVFSAGAVPVRVQNAEDARRMMALQQQIKAEFRQQAGLSKSELERLGGATDNKIIDDLSADLARRQEQKKQEAA